MLTTATGLFTRFWAPVGCSNLLFTLPPDTGAAPSLLPREVPPSPSQEQFQLVPLLWHALLSSSRSSHALGMLVFFGSHLLHLPRSHHRSGGGNTHCAFPRVLPDGCLPSRGGVVQRYAE